MFRMGRATQLKRVCIPGRQIHLQGITGKHIRSQSGFYRATGAVEESDLKADQARGQEVLSSEAKGQLPTLRFEQSDALLNRVRLALP